MLTDIKPILNAARLVGLFPYKIIGHALISTKWDVIYSFFIVFILSITHCYFTYRKYTNNLKPITPDIVNESISIGLTIVVLSNGVNMMLKINKLVSALNHLSSYDISAKFSKKTHQPTLSFSYISLIIVIIYSINNVYSIVSVKPDRIAFAILSNIIYSCSFIQFFKFCGIMWLLYRRFDHLHQLIIPKGNSENTDLFKFSNFFKLKELLFFYFIETMELSINTISKESIFITLEDVRWLHYNLTRAAENINNVYSIQLFFLTIIFSISIAYRIETIIHKLISGDFRSQAFEMHVESFMINCTFLFVMTMACHFTSRKVSIIILF